MNKERKLFGYLACDSLFDKTDRKMIEEIAWCNGWIDYDTLTCLNKEEKASEYGKYILSLSNE